MNKIIKTKKEIIDLEKTNRRMRRICGISQNARVYADMVVKSPNKVLGQGFFFKKDVLIEAIMNGDEDLKLELMELLIENFNSNIEIATSTTNDAPSEDFTNKGEVKTNNEVDLDSIPFSDVEKNYEFKEHEEIDVDEKDDTPLEDMSIEELRALCKENGKRYSHNSKRETLINKLKEVE